QNAFLKTLEEPPPRSVVFLVTDRPERLLATIRSRTPEVRFGRLPADALAAVLRTQGRDAEASAFIAGWADGSLGRAMEGELEALHERRDLAIRLHRAIVDRDLGGAMFAASEIARGGEDGPDRVRQHRRMARNLEILLVWYRDLAVVAAGG